MIFLSDYTCPFCNSKSKMNPFEDSLHLIIECPRCGIYITSYDYIERLDGLTKNTVNSYLFYNGQNRRVYHYIENDSFLNELKSKNDNVLHFSPELAKTYSNFNFAQKIDYFILWISSICEYIGEIITIKYEDFQSALFIKKYDLDGEEYPQEILKIQREEILRYLEYDDNLRSNRYIAEVTDDVEKQEISFKLTLKAWNRIEEINKNAGFGKNVFIAMSFAEGTESTREALKQGISNAGYTPVIIDEVTHNHQIVPEMFKQIRDSKFLVIDVSVPNNGAYYEAGYALGLGKEVIFCCKKEIFDDETKRPHFDVSQKQMIVWKDEADLSDKLEKWIKSLFE